MCFLQCHIISFSVNTAFPLHNSGGSEATNNTYIPKTLINLAFLCSFSLTLNSCQWNSQTDIIINTWTHQTKGNPHRLTRPYR